MHKRIRMQGKPLVIAILSKEPATINFIIKELLQIIVIALLTNKIYVIHQYLFC